MPTLLGFIALLAASPAATFAQVWQIHPGGYSDTKCLDVQGGLFTNGTAVQMYVP